jgi:hypothetical protein
MRRIISRVVLFVLILGHAVTVNATNPPRQYVGRGTARTMRSHPAQMLAGTSTQLLSATSTPHVFNFSNVRGTGLNGQLMFLGNFTVTQTVENGPGHLIRRYKVSGTDAILVEDDHNQTNWGWGIYILDNKGNTIENLVIVLPAYPCHYDQWPFQSPDYVSFKQDDTIFDRSVSAVTTGVWNPSYHGGC